MSCSLYIYIYIYKEDYKKDMRGMRLRQTMAKCQLEEQCTVLCAVKRKSASKDDQCVLKAKYDELYGESKQIFENIT